MSREPRVLIAAAAEDAERVRKAVERQTFRNVTLEDDAAVDMVFLWPRQNELHAAALEKLVLALQLAPMLDGIADRGCGQNGILLRRAKPTLSLIGKWSDGAWEKECSELDLCYLDENLGHADIIPRADDSNVLFTKLPSHFENYQQVPVEPIWPLLWETPDDKSVLFLVSSLPMGGACKFVLDVVEQLKSRGYRVTIITTAHYPNPWLGEFLRVVPDVFVLPHLANAVEFPRLIVHLARAHRCSRVVISHSMLGYQLLPYLRGELPGVAFADYTHIEYESEWPHGGYAQLSISRQSLLDRVIVSSEHLRQWMIGGGAQGEMIDVCHTNIDCQKWKPDPQAATRLRHELSIDDKAALILYPCRIAEQKRPEFMVRIIAALRAATRAPFTVVVAGDGPLMPVLERFIGEYDLTDRFRLLGAVSLQRVAALHNAADIFLLPSKIEGISLALFEAMALESVPVVADVGGQRELVSAECGHLIAPGDPDQELFSYIRALKPLVENPALRRKKAIACRQRVEAHFRLDQMTDAFLGALDRASLQQSPVLPDPALRRDLATMAIDHVRLVCQGQGLQGRYEQLVEVSGKQQKMLAKLQKKFASGLAPARAA